MITKVSTVGSPEEWIHHIYYINGANLFTQAATFLPLLFPPSHGIILCNMCIHVCRLFIFSLKFLAHTDNFIPKHTNTTVTHFLLKWIFLVTTTTLWLRVGPWLLPVLLSHIHTFSHTYLLPRCHSCVSWILIELFATKKEEEEEEAANTGHGPSL